MNTDVVLGALSSCIHWEFLICVFPGAKRTLFRRRVSEGPTFNCSASVTHFWKIFLDTRRSSGRELQCGRILCEFEIMRIQIYRYLSDWLPVSGKWGRCRFQIRRMLDLLLLHCCRIFFQFLYYFNL